MSKSRFRDGYLVDIIQFIFLGHEVRLRNFAHELRSEQKWEELYSKHPGPMKKMAKQALKEHKERKSQEL